MKTQDRKSMPPEDSEGGDYRATYHSDDICRHESPIACDDAVRSTYREQWYTYCVDHMLPVTYVKGNMFGGCRDPDVSAFMLEKIPLEEQVFELMGETFIPCGDSPVDCASQAGDAAMPQALQAADGAAMVEELLACKATDNTKKAAMPRAGGACPADDAAMVQALTMAAVENVLPKKRSLDSPGAEPAAKKGAGNEHRGRADVLRLVTYKHFAGQLREVDLSPTETVQVKVDPLEGMSILREYAEACREMKLCTDDEANCILGAPDGHASCAFVRNMHRVFKTAGISEATFRHNGVLKICDSWSIHIGTYYVKDFLWKKGLPKLCTSAPTVYQNVYTFFEEKKKNASA